jgi:crotonobetainyl-CoA:carnitine CoA-transferase CaiB-like acyl-CoA transferase
MTVPTDDSGLATRRVINHPVNIADLPRRPVHPAPDLGQHSDEILGSLGFRPAEIAELRDERVI